MKDITGRMKDITGRVPKVGDIIYYPQHSGLCIGQVVETNVGKYDHLRLSSRLVCGTYAKYTYWYPGKSITDLMLHNAHRVVESITDFLITDLQSPLDLPSLVSKQVFLKRLKKENEEPG